MKKNVLIVLMLVIANIGLSYGQVVIGGGEIPVEGALIDIKSKQADADNTTADKGVMMPRVMLTDIKKLTPLVKTETPENKKEHIGLQVYHIGGGTSTISPGFKIWNGEKWTELYESTATQWVYMPPFPIKMYESTEQKVDLYAKYKEQMDTAKTGVKIWDESEVTFKIIGFDATSFNGTPVINVEGGKQMLVFKAAVGKLTAASYLNIIIIKK